MEMECVDEKYVISPSTGVPYSAEDMDKKRKNTKIRDYLNKLNQAREWVAKQLSKDMSIASFIMELPKGELLGDLSNVFGNNLNVYRNKDKDYHHTDNINGFLEWLKTIKLSDYFQFEVLDLYENKNLHKVIYCIHGLAFFLEKYGIAKGLQESNEKFSKEEEKLVEDKFGTDLKFDTEEIKTYAVDNKALNTDSEERCENVDPNKNANDATELLSRLVYGEETNNFDSVLKEAMEKNPEAISQIKEFGRAFFWKNGSFRNMNVLRKLIDMKDEEEYIDTMETIKRKHHIFKELKNINQFEKEKRQLLENSRLLLDNQCKYKGISFHIHGEMNNFKTMYVELIRNYEFLYQLSQVEEVPFSVLYPGNYVGDYYFSRFLEYCGRVHSLSDVRKVSIERFLSSTVFRGIVEGINKIRRCPLKKYNVSGEKDAFTKVRFHSSFQKKDIKEEDTISHRIAEDNDENIENLIKELDEYESMINKKEDTERTIHDTYDPEDEDHVLVVKNADLTKEINLSMGGEVCDPIEIYKRTYGKNVLLEDAINEDSVRKEIGKTLSEIDDTIQRIVNFLKEIDFPYYVLAYKDTQRFYTDFIEPAIVLSDASYIAPATKNILDIKQEITTVTDYFMIRKPEKIKNHLAINMEEVNNIVILLKKYIGLAGRSMRDLVEKMPVYTIDKKNGYMIEIADDEKMEEIYDKERKNEADVVPLTVDGKELDDGTEDSQIVKSHFIKPIRKIRYRKEKFVLCLQNCIPEYDNIVGLMLDNLLEDIKRRLFLFLRLSKRVTLYDVIMNTDPEEEEAFLDTEIYKKRKTGLRNLKKESVRDINTLIESQMLGKITHKCKKDESNINNICLCKIGSGIACGGKDCAKTRYMTEKTMAPVDVGFCECWGDLLLVVIFNDFNKHKMIDLTPETYVNLAEKSDGLRKDICTLYEYSGKLAESMVEAKYGFIFNRQSKPYSKYGTYTIPFETLRPIGSDFSGIEDMECVVSMNTPMIINLNICLCGKSVYVFESLRVDFLLGLLESGEKYLRSHECGIDISALIDVVNEKYLK